MGSKQGIELDFSFDLNNIENLFEGVATCTQHYCWGTQQVVKWQKCSSGKTISGRTFFRKTPFPETFRKNLLSEEEFVIPEVLRNSFQKNVIRNVSGRNFFWKISFYFRKKGLPKMCFFLKNDFL